MQQNGRTPPISLSIFSIEDLSQEISITQFMSYRFQSSILVPADSFSMEVFYKPQPDQRKPADGDICVLRANGVPVCTGILDQVDMETTLEGTKLQLQGRDLLGQWQDQDSVTIDSKIVWFNQANVDQMVASLAVNTRLDPKRLIKRDTPGRPYMFATQPGETKLSSMQRYCEPLGIYFWMDGSGSLIVGRPDVFGVRDGPAGTLFMKSTSRATNVIAMGSTRASTQIPNIIVPIWGGQETIQDRIKPEKAIYNGAAGPARLLNFGHRVPKAVVVSPPEGSAPQDLADLNALSVANQNAAQQNKIKPGSSNLLQAYGKREMARANLNELKVRVTMVGHYNDSAAPLLIDSVYRIQYEADDIDQQMYLYEVEYTMDEHTGPMTRAMFCKPTALVSDVRAL
jgi:prophage tail gpP-like protein